MIAWLRIAGERVLQLYSDAAALDLMDTAFEQSPYLTSLGTLRESSDGETPNATATLSADALELFDDPPIGAEASYQFDNEDPFVGVIQSIKVTADGVTLGIEA